MLVETNMTTDLIAFSKKRRYRKVKRLTIFRNKFNDDFDL